MTGCNDDISSESKLLDLFEEMRCFFFFTRKIKLTILSLKAIIYTWYLRRSAAVLYTTNTRLFDSEYAKF